jgi:hypothetical protein
MGYPRVGRVSTTGCGSIGCRSSVYHKLVMEDKAWTLEQRVLVFLLTS